MIANCFLFCQATFRQLLVFVVITIILTGCRELVQNEFPEFAPIPTVNSFLAADSALMVHISLAGKMDSIPLALVDEAVVKCFVNDSASGLLTPVGNGYFKSDIRMKQGSVYRIQVVVPGFPELLATDTIPERTPLTSIEHINNAGVDEEGYPFPAIRVTFPVNQDRIQYFQVILKINSWKDHWTIGFFKDFSDTNLLAEGLPIAVFSTARIKSDWYTLKLDYSPVSYSGSNGIIRPDLDPFFVELKSISYSYYHYLRQRYLYETGRYPEFSFGPNHTFPLYSNITNGLGIFAGYSQFKSEIITPQI
jgi:hypothetical protein